jgi:hypothetical protein
MRGSRGDLPPNVGAEADCHGPLSCSEGAGTRDNPGTHHIAGHVIRRGRPLPARNNADELRVTDQQPIALGAGDGSADRDANQRIDSGMEHLPHCDP